MKTTDEIKADIFALLELLPKDYNLNLGLSVIVIDGELRGSHLYFPYLVPALYDVYRECLISNYIREEETHLQIEFSKIAAMLLSSPAIVNQLDELNKIKLNVITHPPYSVSMEEIKEIIHLNLQALPEELDATDISKEKKSIAHKAVVMTKKLVKKESKPIYPPIILKTLKDHLHYLININTADEGRTDLSYIILILMELHTHITYIQNQLVHKNKTSEALNNLETNVKHISNFLVQHSAFKSSRGQPVVLQENDLARLSELSSTSGISVKKPS